MECDAGTERLVLRMVSATMITESALQLGFDALKGKQLEQFLLSFQVGIICFIANWLWRVNNLCYFANCLKKI